MTMVRGCKRSLQRPDAFFGMIRSAITRQPGVVRRRPKRLSTFGVDDSMISAFQHAAREFSHGGFVVNGQGLLPGSHPPETHRIALEFSWWNRGGSPHALNTTESFAFEPIAFI